MSADKSRFFFSFFLNSKKGGKGKTRRSIPELSQWARCLAHSLRRDESGSVEREPAPWFHTHYHLLQRRGEWENETAYRDCAKSPVFIHPHVFRSRSLSHNALISLYYMVCVFLQGSPCKVTVLITLAQIVTSRSHTPGFACQSQVTQPVEGDVLGKGKSFVRFWLQYHLRVSFIFQVSDKFWCLSPGLLLRDNVRIVWLGLKPPFLFSLNHFIHPYFPSALSSLIFNFLS